MNYDESDIGYDTVSKAIFHTQNAFQENEYYEFESRQEFAHWAAKTIKRHDF